MIGNDKMAVGVVNILLHDPQEQFALAGFHYFQILEDNRGEILGAHDIIGLGWYLDALHDIGGKGQGGGQICGQFIDQKIVNLSQWNDNQS